MVVMHETNTSTKACTRHTIVCWYINHCILNCGKLHLSSTFNLLMPKSQIRKLASTKHLAQISDLVSGLSRVASGLRQRSKAYHQVASLSAVPIECSKVLSQPFSSSYLALIPMFEAQTKGHRWWHWTSCKEKDNGSLWRRAFMQGRYSFNCISLVISE